MRMGFKIGVSVLLPVMTLALAPAANAQDKLLPVTVELGDVSLTPIRESGCNAVCDNPSSDPLATVRLDPSNMRAARLT